MYDTYDTPVRLNTYMPLGGQTFSYAACWRLTDSISFSTSQYLP
jgi:hypothetical protein